MLEADADIIGHINGGHTALPDAQITCLCEQCLRGIEIVHNGNERAGLLAMRLAPFTPRPVDTSAWRNIRDGFAFVARTAYERWRQQSGADNDPEDAFDDRYLKLGTTIDKEHVNKLGWTAPLEAVILGDGGPVHTGIVRMLVEAGANVNIADREGVTPLAHAKRHGFREMARILEGRGGR